MDRLSETELVIAEKYCHGLTDKEVADQLGKPVWTIRTHKNTFMQNSAFQQHMSLYSTWLHGRMIRTGTSRNFASKVSQL